MLEAAIILPDLPFVPDLIIEVGDRSGMLPKPAMSIGTTFPRMDRIRCPSDWT